MAPGKSNKKGDKSDKRNKDKRQPVFMTTSLTQKRKSGGTEFPLLNFPDIHQQNPWEAPAAKKKWVIDNKVPVGHSDNPDPIYILKLGDIVNVKQQNIQVDGSEVSWSEIVYFDTSYSREEKKYITTTISGWVDGLYLEDYVEKFPENEVTILNPTENPNDAQQYMLWEGDVKYNMCGEFCAAYIVKKDIDPASSIESVLERWRDSPTKNSFSYSSSRVRDGLYVPHIRNILQTYPEFNNTQDKDLIVDLKEGLKGGSLTWEGVKEKLKTHYLIANVRISTSKGELIKKNLPGVQHWVLLESVTRNGNRVELYNPFPNQRQEYSFTEFVSSCSAGLTGLWVKRKTPLLEDPEEGIKEDVHQVNLGTDRHDPGQAQQYIYREGGRKTNLCGEFSVTYIIDKSIDKAISHWQKRPPTDLRELVTILSAYGCFPKKDADGLQTNLFSIGSVLDFWRKTQKELYDYYVRQNKPTGTVELRNILKSYGYINPGDLMDLKTGLMDQKTKKYLPTPGKMAKMLETHFLIAGVGIDGIKGRLKTGNAIRHWVVVERVIPAGKQYINTYLGGNRGWVELYNPFMNVIEEYSYREFTSSMNETGGDWYGLWVKRDINPVFKSQPTQLPSYDESQKNVGKKNKKGGKNAWSEQKLRKDIEKKIRNGRSPQEIIPILFRQSGWSREAIAALLPVQENKDDELANALLSTVREQLGVESLPSEVEAWVTKRARGNSSLAVDLAYALRESGALIIEDKIGRLNGSVISKPKSAIETSINDITSQASPTIKDVIGSAFAARAMKEIADAQSAGG